MKRLPATSAALTIKAMADAAMPALVPPPHCPLRDGDLPFWDGIIRARARDEWTGADLVVAGQLARCQADIERESVLLDAESMVVENAKGTVVLNARVTVLQQLAQREMALMRTLRMGGATRGDPRENAGRRKIQGQAEKLRDELAGEELLAQ